MDKINKSLIDQIKKYKIHIENQIDAGLLKESLESIEEYRKLMPADPDIFALIAMVAISKEEYDLAWFYLWTGLLKHPENVDLNYNMAIIQEMKEDYLQGIFYYSRAIEVCTDNSLKSEINDKIIMLKNKILNFTVSQKKSQQNKEQIKQFVHDSLIKQSKVKLVPTIEKFVIDKKLKVLQGSMEIANQMSTLSSILKIKGHYSRTLCYYPNYLNYDSDYKLDLTDSTNYDLNTLKSKKLSVELIPNFDLFHFHFGTSLTLDRTDLTVLKQLKKKVLMQHWGSDVRMYSKAVKNNPFVVVKNLNEDTLKRELNFLAKYIDHCVVGDFELCDTLSEHYNNVHVVPTMLDINKYPINNFPIKNEKLLIVHAPTSPEVKGSKYIIKSIEELQLKYDFDFKLVQGMPHEQAKLIYQKADLIIDQILVGSHGLFALESMAMGKTVICWISDFMKDKYPKDIPIISANPTDIKEKIEFVLNNKDMLDEIGRKGRTYVEKYHDMNKVSLQMIKLYQSI
jgi:glycosyltransferase involved in cell wall biosynthesis